RRRQHRGQQEVAGDVQCASAVGENEGGEDVERSLFSHAREGGEHDLLRMASDDFQNRRALESALGEKLGKDGRLENSKADIEADDDKEQAQHERYAPTPGEKLLAGHLAEREHREVG